MTDLEICNRALAHLGDFKIADLEAATLAADTRAEVVNRFLPLAKREVLSTMDWAFAFADAELTATTAPTLMWQHAHSYPSGVCRVVGLYGAAQTAPPAEEWSKMEHYALSLGVVKSNTEFVAMQYVSDAAFSVWPGKAQAACARLLAHYVAVPISGDERKADRHLQLYLREDLPHAQHEHAVEYASNDNHDSTELITSSDLYRQSIAGLTSLETN